MAVAAAGLSPGESVSCGGLEIVALDAIPRGHKIAVHPIGRGEKVVKYGVHIGEAAAAIPPGSHVHTHNVRDITGELSAEREKNFRERGFSS